MPSGSMSFLGSVLLSSDPRAGFCVIWTSFSPDMRAVVSVPHLADHEHMLVYG